VAADKKGSTIVIKKITVVAGGGHGGAWKVAFADFMTAMMAFFLVMWLLATASEPQKKAVSDYFSTPSVIEYNFQNFGVELTLEKLFLDLINEPLKTLDTFITPMDKNPNILQFGTKKIVMAYMAEQLGAVASDVNVTADAVIFEVPDSLLFERASALPAPQFVSIMERVKGVTAGLQDSDVEITSVVYRQYVPDSDAVLAKKIAEQRSDLLQERVRSGLEHEGVNVHAHSQVKNDDRGPHDNHAGYGVVRFEIKQQKATPDGKKPKPFKDSIFGNGDTNKSAYDNFVQQITTHKARDPQSVNGGKNRRSKNPVDVEARAAIESEAPAAEAPSPEVDLPRELPRKE
jgi:chemotaxis protein MotB